MTAASRAMTTTTTACTRSPWRNIGMSGGGGTETPAISPHNPDIMIINCDMSGAYRTCDGGKNWTMLHWSNLMGCPFCAPAFHPTDPSIVYAASGYPAELRISHDAGINWEPIGENLPGGLCFIAIHPDAPNHMLAATQTEVYASEDAGATWTQTHTSLPEALIRGIFFPRDTGKAFVATAQGILISTDHGKKWTVHNAWIPENLGIYTVAQASDPKTKTCILYAWLDTTNQETTDSDLGELWISHDEGTTWARQSALTTGTGIRNALSNHSTGSYRLLACDANPMRVYAAMPVATKADTILRSDDAGATWTAIAGFDKTSGKFSMGENYIGNYFNSCVNWCITCAAIDPCNPDHMIFSHYCSVFQTKDGGATWESIETRVAPNQSRPLTNKHRWECNGLANTTTWNYYITPSNHQRHFTCYTDIGLVRSDDNGASWTFMREFGPNCYQLCFDPAVPERFWAALGIVHDIPNNNIVTGSHYRPSHNFGCIAYTENNGDTFTPCIGDLPCSDKTKHFDDCGFPRCDGTVTSIILDPTSPVESRTLYASLFDKGVYRSDDGGQTWKDCSKGLGAPGVNMRVYRLHRHEDGTLFCNVTGQREGLDPTKQLIRDGVGLYRSRNGGESWEDLTKDMEIYWLTDYAVDPRDSNVLWLSVCDCPNRKIDEGGLFRSTNGGKTWTLNTRKSKLHFGVTFRPENPDHLYMTLNYNFAKCPPLWFSSDNGATWTPFEDYPFNGAHRVAFDPDNADEIVITSYGASALRGPAYPACQA